MHCDPIPTLDDLERRFAAFRLSTGSKRRRIPLALREAVLRAVNSGVSVSSIRRRCGVCPRQVEVWRRLQAGSTATGDPLQQDDVQARIFTVSDSGPNPVLSPPSGNEAHLEVRLGRWSLSLHCGNPGRRES